MKRLIHSCVQREAVKRSVSLPHHVVSHTLHEQNTIWSSLEFIWLYYKITLIIIIVENGHFLLFDSNFGLIQASQLYISLWTL